MGKRTRTAQWPGGGDDTNDDEGHGPRGRRRMPLALKVGIPVVLISIAGTLVVGAAALAETRARINQTYVSQAGDLARFIEEQYLVTQGVTPMISKMQNLIVDHPMVTRIRLFDRRGIPTLWASTFPLDGGMNPQPFDVSSSLGSRDTNVDGQRMLEVVVPVARSPDFTDVAVYFSLQARNEAMSSITKRIGIEVAMVGVFEAIALAISMYLLVVRRIRRIDRAAVAVAGGDLSVRLPEGSERRGRDELVNVAREFDHMVEAVGARVEKEREDAERLRQLDEAKNTLLHAVSHDLRAH